MERRRNNIRTYIKPRIVLRFNLCIFLFQSGTIGGAVLTPWCHAARMIVN